MNHPITPPVKRRRVVHPTAAEIRRARKTASRPDGSVSALGVMVALEEPDWTPDFTAPTAPSPRRTKR